MRLTDETQDDGSWADLLAGGQIARLRKRYVHGQIDGGIDTGRGRHRRSTMRTTEGLGGQVGMRPGHAERRSHPLPAMTGLAGEIGDLVHGQDGKDRITLTP